jgi:hypothetical protein
MATPLSTVFAANQTEEIIQLIHIFFVRKRGFFSYYLFPLFNNTLSAAPKSHTSRLEVIH